MVIFKTSVACIFAAIVDLLFAKKIASGVVIFSLQIGLICVKVVMIFGTILFHNKEITVRH